MNGALKIALVQTHLLWEDPEGNRALFSDILATVPDDIDLIVLPEMFTTGFTMNPQHLATEERDKTLIWMKQWAQSKDAAIMGSMVNPEIDGYYNRLWFIEPESERSYDKRHTFTLAGEDKVYQAGTSKELISFRGFLLCPLICYDLRFPVWARNVEDYDVLFYVANWPKPRISAWDALLKARAIENMAYCIGVNRVGLDDAGHEYTGHSAVYDVLGNTIAFSKKEEVLYATISKAHIDETRSKLKFLQDRDAFNLK